MINSNNFVYSKAAAARILGIDAYEIARFEVWAYVCFVHVRGHRPTFISKKAFRQHFVEWRKEQARCRRQPLRGSLCVSRIADNHYRVVNPKKWLTTGLC